MTHNYRPQTKFAKVMFLHVSVCPQEGKTWAGTPQAGTPPWAGTPPLGRYTAPGQEHPLGGYTPGQVHPPGQVPPWCMLGDTGNKRAVRILLECILVHISNCSYLQYPSPLRAPFIFDLIVHPPIVIPDLETFRQ